MRGVDPLEQFSECMHRGKTAMFFETPQFAAGLANRLPNNGF